MTNNSSRIRNGEIVGDLTREEEQFWDSLAIELSTRRFYMLGYCREDLDNFRKSTSSDYERNAKRWNKRNPDKEPRLFGDELMATIPCRCQKFSNGLSDEDINIECPVCNIKRLRREMDEIALEERKQQVLSRIKK